MKLKEAQWRMNSLRTLVIRDDKLIMQKLALLWLSMSCILESVNPLDFPLNSARNQLIRHNRIHRN